MSTKKVLIKNKLRLKPTGRANPANKNPANVLDENNNVVGSVKPSKIIQTVFRTGKERS